MHLYHVLPRHRLEQKLAYARAHGGRLQLTPHEASKDSAAGAVSAYLHCLPDLVGGIAFSIKERVAALRITLAPGARVAKLRGTRDQLDLAAAAREAAVLHVQWDEPGLRYQEWLLVDESAVLEWTADPEVLAQDYQEQLERLSAGRMSSRAFFYPDLDPASQLPMARLTGHRLRYHEVEDPEALFQAHCKATHRIGAEGSTPTKHLFFVGQPFVDLARRAALPRWRERWSLACVSGEAPWSRIDEVLTEAAERLTEGLRGCADATGPLELHLADLRAEPDVPARFVLGLRLPPDHPLDTPLAGLHLTAFRPQGARAVHRGPLWELERRVQRLVAPDPEARVLSYVFHAFHGARSPENVLGLAVGSELPDLRSSA